MSEKSRNPNLIAQLRYGKIQTKFTHFSVIAEGVVGELKHGFTSTPGPAWMSMKAWVESSQEAIRMVQSIGHEIGFEVSGRVHVYNSNPDEDPPEKDPMAYDIKFFPFDPNK